jgi:hypothetical protein
VLAVQWTGQVVFGQNVRLRCGKETLLMQIALNRQDFQALFMLPRELQRKGIFLWQLAEVAWPRPQAIEALDHLLCLAHAVTHVYVLLADPRGATVVSHAVYEPTLDGLNTAADWPSLVASSIGWARDVVLTFDFADNEPWRARTPLFNFWAYNQADYQKRQRHT